MPRIRSGLVQVEGLDELNKALRSMDKGLQKQLRLTNKEVASFVAEDARAAAMSIGGVAAHVAPSIKASAGATSAGVAFGGSAYPMAMGAEFGAAQNSPRRRRTGTYLGFNQFQPWTGSGSDAGYFVYPSIRRDMDRIETEYGQAIDRLLRQVGLR